MNPTNADSLSAPRLRSNWLRLFLVALAFLIGASSISSAATIGPTPVAVSGMPAPAGGNYSSFGGFIPALNASGQVAFRATLTGGSSSSGIFVSGPGSSGTLHAVALQGTAAPAGGNYNTLYSPVLNASGQLGYFATLTGGSSTSGIFAGNPGSMQAVALQGTAATASGNYVSLSSTPVINATGQVAFHSGLNGGSSPHGLFAGSPGSVQTVALEYTAAPGGGSYNVLGLPTTPLLNAAGKVAYIANVSSGEGIFVGVPGSMQRVAVQGTAAPAGGNYTGFDYLALNASGQIAYSADLTGQATTRGIFAGAPGSIQAVALQYTPAPAGGNYGSFVALSLNETGQVAFRANLIGGSSSTGIFAGSPGSLQTIALSGTATPDGVGNFNVLFSDMAFNASGQVAFLSSLSGTGVTTANDTGLFAGSAGNVVKIVREGDILDVNPSAGIDLRTVSTITFFNSYGGQDGRAMSLNDDGLLVYRLSFTDGSSGIFTSQINTVPEPGTLGLLTLGGVAVFWKWRRRRC